MAESSAPLPLDASDRRRLGALRRDLALVAGSGGILLIGSAGGLGQATMGLDPLRWLVLPLLLWGYISVLSYLKLPYHRSKNGPLLRILGPGMVLALVRGVLLAGLAGFLLVDLPQGVWQWIPAMLYTIAATMDYFDGYLARRSGTQSALGERLDIELDALGLLIAVSVAIRIGKLPALFLLIGVGRYAFLWSQALLDRLGVRRRDLPESLSRRPIAGFTMGFVSASLWPVVTPQAAATAGLLFLAAFLLSFTRDWLITVGLLDPHSGLYRSVRSRARSWLLNWIPLALRAAVAWAVLREITPGMSAPPLPGIPGSATSAAIVISAPLAMTSLMMVAGFLARSAAFVHFFPLGLLIYANGLTLSRTVLMLAAILVLMLGSGRYSLWEPERTVFSRRPGEAWDES